MQRVFVTGAGGFVGRHLDARLREAGCDVFGFGGDVRDPDALRAELADAEPDAIVHLAGVASVAAASGAELEAWEVNATGTLHVCLAARDVAPGARLLLASSAEVYGAVAAERQPIRESEPVAPAAAYGLSKAAAELAARHSGLDVIVARAFNHVGPGQREQFAVASFAAQVARIERGDAEPIIHVGNLDARRDFLDVRDVVEAYWLLLARAPADTYNVASGRAVALRDVLDALLRLAVRPVEVEVDAARLRPVDVPLLCGDASRLRTATGWQPRFPLERTLADVLASERTTGVSS